MGILLDDPDDKFYGSIPDLGEALNIFATKQAKILLESVGEVFYKHGVCKDYGLTMIHRHFDLNPKEILVETIKDDETMSIAIPWNYEGTEASPMDFSLWNSFDLSTKSFVIPKTWAFAPTGELKAFEFLSTNQKLPSPSHEFIVELHHALAQLGLDRIVGLRRTLKLKETISLENTPEGVRANITKFGALPNDIDLTTLVQAMWHFNEDGKFRKNIGDFCIHDPNCSHSCCSI